MRLTLLILSTAVSVYTFSSCATGGKKKSSKEVQSSSYSSKRSGRKASSSGGNRIAVSGNERPFVSSLGNASMTSKEVSKSKARGIADRIERKVKASKNVSADDVMAAMSAKRISGAGYNSVVNTAKRLVGQEVRKNINSELPDVAELELAIAAFQEKRYGMAEYYIIKLRESKLAQLRSAALTLDGLMLYRFRTVRAAVEAWRAALKEDASNQAARLNLAVLAIEHGDSKNAVRNLSGTEQDWFVSGLLASAEKLQLKGKRAQDLCRKALGSQPKNRMLLYNCGLVDYQVANDFNGANDKLGKANSMSGGSPELGDKIIRALRDVKNARAAAAKAVKAPAKSSKGTKKKGPSK